MGYIVVGFSTAGILKQQWLSIVAAVAILGCGPAHRTDQGPPEKAEPPGPLAELAFTISEGKGFHPEGTAISPDGSTLAIHPFGGLVELWDTATGKKRQELADSPVKGMAFSPDGRILVGVSAEMGLPEDAVISWDTDRWQRTVWSSDVRLGPYLGFSPDGKQLVTSGLFTSPELWDVASKSHRPIAALKGCDHLRFSADGKVLFVSGSVYRDIAAGKEVPRRPFRGEPWPSPDGRLLFVSAPESLREAKNLLVDWKAEKVERELPIPENGALYAAFSPHGSVLATAGERLGVKLWDVATGKELLTLPGISGTLNRPRVEFARSGRYLVASDNHKIQVWKYRGT